MPGAGRSPVEPDPQSSASRALPPVVCVDLDGTLVATDTLWESLITILFRKPSALIPVLFSISGGKAHFKAVVARYASLRVDRLPYRDSLLRYLEEQKRSGRRLVLATAAHHSIAHAVAAYLGLFDQVLATSGDRNLSGKAKGALLAETLQGASFSYAGNAAEDLAVWEHAATAIPTAARLRIVNRIPIPVEASFPEERRPLLSMFRAMRVHQWIKNLLVFVPLVTSHDLGNMDRIEVGLLAFLAFCFTASAQYLINDLIDLDSDRAHPAKRRRALASGDLPIPAGLFLAAALLVAAGAVVYSSRSILLGSVFAAYLAASLLYSAWLKTKPILDVFTLAGLYTFRIVAGGLVTEHPASLWLLTFSFLFFLSLGFLKRFVELAGAGDSPGEAVGRRGYFGGESLLLMSMGLSTGLASNVVLALYVNSETANQLYVQPQALWGLVPIGLFVQCQLWLAGSRGEIVEDPVRYVLSDRLMWACLAAGAITYVTAIGIVHL